MQRDVEVNFLLLFFCLIFKIGIKLFFHESLEKASGIFEKDISEMNL
jgi:hypothetical protein